MPRSSSTKARRWPTAQGIVLDSDPEELIDYAARPEVAYDHKASMLQDVEARRQTEVDFLNGGIVEFGREARRADADTRDDLGTGERGGGIVAARRSIAGTRTVSRGDGEGRPRRRDGDGNEYSGFEGAVTYMSGFVIVHRYAYVLLPLEGEPSIVFPTEARYVGEHGTTWIEDQVFVDKPGEWLAERLGQARRVYGSTTS